MLKGLPATNANPFGFDDANGVPSLGFVPFDASVVEMVRVYVRILLKFCKQTVLLHIFMAGLSPFSNR